jgi:hypothetical protein
LGLDNISLFDRSSPLPNGANLEQADGTSWVAFFCNAMFKIAVELAHYDNSYEDVASKFFEHFVAISSAINTFGGSGLFDEASGFYYDRLRNADGSAIIVPLRSYVGIVPLFSLINLSSAEVDHLEGLRKRSLWFVRNRPELARSVKVSKLSAAKHAPGAPKATLQPLNSSSDGAKSPRSRPKLEVYQEQTRKHQAEHGHSDLTLFQLSIPSKRRLNSILAYVLDENEFLSPYGIRSLSKVHLNNPVVLHLEGREFRCDYAPGESQTSMFGGNSK